MEKVIAYCGIICSECPAFLATQKDDDNKRKKVADRWSKDYNSDIKPEDINCDGCITTTKNVFRYCNVCQIRRCGMDRNVKNCAYCDDYACDKLIQFHESTQPEIKQTLENIRKNL
ncbi:MAG: DUF3795 domain-containing protein [Candidatus Thorarchaeota archaeon]